jgi:hypothetical protein
MLRYLPVVAGEYTVLSVFSVLLIVKPSPSIRQDGLGITGTTIGLLPLRALIPEEKESNDK